MGPSSEVSSLTRSCEPPAGLPGMITPSGCPAGMILMGHVGRSGKEVGKLLPEKARKSSRPGLRACPPHLMCCVLCVRWWEAGRHAPLLPEHPRKRVAKRLDQEVAAAGGLFTPGVAPRESELLCHRLSVVLALLPLLLPDMPAANSTLVLSAAQPTVRRKLGMAEQCLSI